MGSGGILSRSVWAPQELSSSRTAAGGLWPGPVGEQAAAGGSIILPCPEYHAMGSTVIPSPQVHASLHLQFPGYLLPETYSCFPICRLPPAAGRACPGLGTNPTTPSIAKSEQRPVHNPHVLLSWSPKKEQAATSVH